MSDSTGAKQSNLPKQRKLGRLMHYLVSNAYSFTVGVMGFVHATLMIIFLIADVMPLVYFNILSVVVYINRIIIDFAI